MLRLIEIALLRCGLNINIICFEEKLACSRASKQDIYGDSSEGHIESCTPGEQIVGARLQASLNNRSHDNWV